MRVIIIIVGRVRKRARAQPTYKAHTRTQQYKANTHTHTITQKADWWALVQHNPVPIIINSMVQLQMNEQAARATKAR